MNNNKLHRAREKSLYTELILDEEIKEGINSIMGSSIQEVSNEAVSKLSKINTKPLHVATEKKMKKKVATPAKLISQKLFVLVQRRRFYSHHSPLSLYSPTWSQVEDFESFAIDCMRGLFSSSLSLYCLLFLPIREIYFRFPFNWLYLIKNYLSYKIVASYVILELVPMLLFTWNGFIDINLVFVVFHNHLWDANNDVG